MRVLVLLLGACALQSSGSAKGASEVTTDAAATVDEGGHADPEAPDKVMFLGMCARGETDTVKAYLDEGPEHVKAYLNAVTEDGESALFLASVKGANEVLELLLGSPEMTPALKNLANYDGETALMAAALQGHCSAVELLLNSGDMDVDKRHHVLGYTALNFASAAQAAKGKPCADGSETADGKSSVERLRLAGGRYLADDGTYQVLPAPLPQRSRPTAAAMRLPVLPGIAEEAGGELSSRLKKSARGPAVSEEKACCCNSLYGDVSNVKPMHFMKLANAGKCATTDCKKCDPRADDDANKDLCAVAPNHGSCKK